VVIGFKRSQQQAEQDDVLNQNNDFDDWTNL